MKTLIHIVIGYLSAVTAAALCQAGWWIRSRGIQCPLLGRRRRGHGISCGGVPAAPDGAIRERRCALGVGGWARWVGSQTRSRRRWSQGQVGLQSSSMR
jgi:hypothetical protein